MTGSSHDGRLPVTIVTGFLGSGKTTFLRRSLQDGRLSGALLVVNEAAPYGVDDRLLRGDADAVALLANGCICCRVDKGVKEELHRILALNGRGLRFDSVVIELSGLADPVVVMATIASDPYLDGQLRIGLVVTLVDCLHATDNDRDYPEHRRQIEAADIVLLTKADLATREQVEHSRALVAGLLPLAPCLPAGELHVDDLLGREAGLRADRLGLERFAPQPRTGLAPGGWQRPAPAAGRFVCRPPDAASFCIRIEGRLDWTRLSLWLSLLVHAHGERILRIKAFSPSTRPLPRFSSTAFATSSISRSIWTAGPAKTAHPILSSSSSRSSRTFSCVR